MKKTYFNTALMAICAAGIMTCSGCAHDNLPTEEYIKENTSSPDEYGTFTATFIPKMYQPMSRAAVEGQSTAVQSLKYLIYKDNGNGEFFYYTEGDVFGADAAEGADKNYSWPYTDKIQVTLPGGNYKVAFVANANPKLFGEHCNTLLEYKADDSGKWEDVRLHMPDMPFSDNNMFYMDAVEVNAAHPVSEVWLERKVNKIQLWRETVASDNNQILTLLLDNAWNHLAGEDPVTGLLGGQLGDAITPVLKGVLGPLENILLEPILKGLVEGLRPLVIDGLAPLLDETLKMNQKYALLQELTNPWAIAAHGAVVEFKQVPEALNLDGKAASMYPNPTQCVYDLQENGNFRYIEITGLADTETRWEIGQIDILKQGLVGGIVDGVVDNEMILDGSLIDTNKEGIAYQFQPNYKYKSVYSLISLNVDESVYTESEGTSPLTVTVRLGDIANLNDLLKGIIQGAANDDSMADDSLLGDIGDILGGLVGTVGQLVHLLLTSLGGLDKVLDGLISGLTDITLDITLPINVNALGVETLEVTGSWGDITTVQ